MMRDLTGTRQTEVFGLSLSPAQVLGAHLWSGLGRQAKKDRRPRGRR